MVGRMIDLFGVGDTLPNEIIDGNTLRAQYGIDTNEVYPRLILKLLPVGLIGVMIACMVSALSIDSECDIKLCIYFVYNGLL